MLQALADAIPCTITKGQPSGKADVLLTWGMGHIGRKPIIEAHKANGGRVVGVDLGYWDRRSSADTEQNFRLTIDDDHPWIYVAPQDGSRFDESGIVLREDADPDGPILLAEMGRKSERLFPHWQPRTIKRLKLDYPGRPIVMRRKSPDNGPIEQALVGKSLVVCRHSNVAVDACIAGVPVECDNGIAYALYRHGKNPSREQRLEFLRSVAWWQYKPSEAEQAWKFLLTVLG